MTAQTNFMALIMKNDEQFLKELGTRIRGLRKAHGMTQDELAADMGVTQALIASYESARRSIPLRKLVAMSEIFGVSIEDIVGQRSEQRRKPGPASVLERKISEIEKLPRSDQQFFIRMLDSALAQAH